MPTSTSRLAYNDCVDLFEAALADPEGARYQVPPGDYGSAQHFRMRMQTFRSVDRVDNMKIHEKGDPLYGRSIYDALVVRLKEDTEGKWWVYVTHIKIDPEAIEPLTEAATPEAPR